MSASSFGSGDGNLRAMASKLIAMYAKYVTSSPDASSHSTKPACPTRSIALEHRPRMEILVLGLLIKDLLTNRFETSLVFLLYRVYRVYLDCPGYLGSKTPETTLPRLNTPEQD